jgi:predicted metalloprotease
MAVGGGGIGILLIALVIYLLGGNPQPLLQQAQQQQRQQQANAPAGPVDPAEEEQVAFVKTVLADTEDVWRKIFRDAGKQYQEPQLVLFTDQVQSACGVAGASTGPFYCPGDSKVYLDLSFFRDLEIKFRAAGDFPRAYVVAHEVGHHIQNLLGTTDWMDQQRRKLSEVQYNDLSVRLELQADFFAGVWSHYMRKELEPGDVEEALAAAAAIGDDRLQMQAQGYVVPESFTHGTSEQRARWFMKGFKTGDLSQGDTFKAAKL